MTEIFVKYNARESDFRDLERYVTGEKNRFLRMYDVSIKFTNNENSDKGKATISVKHIDEDWDSEEALMDTLISILIKERKNYTTILRDVGPDM